MINMNLPEILSPVGNEEMLTAAVRSGADAVYLGAKEFSARRNAENFDLEELKKAIEYCHIRGVRVYLTLNILIKDTEMESAFNLARDAYNAGVDGIIIQDLGLARIIHEKIPDFPLHASTQLSVHSPSALPILKELGFCQVVAAREMSKKDLTALCEKATELSMTVEVFVHGALCMCMSGQCLLSAFLGSRSGNRGLCAGPCRLPFKAENGTGYDLSLKDLSLLDYLRELKEMGVASFKIEGRMKRPEYVAAATAACRQALDKGYVETALAETLRNVFSRSGFTDGYYTDNLGKTMFGIRTKEDVVSADKAFPYLHELYRKERQSIPVGVKAKILRGMPISLTLSDGENTVTATGNIPQEAKNRALTYEDALKNICKFGGTPYRDEGGGIELNDGLFVSAGELNALRREACGMLDEIRAKVKRKKSNAVYNNQTAPASHRQLKLVARFENAAQIPDNLEGISAIMFPLEEDPEISLPENIIKIVDIPRGIVSERLISKRLDIFKENGFTIAAGGNLAAVEIARKKGFTVIADTGLNISSAQTVETFNNLGLKAAVLSSELTLNEANGINSQMPLGIIAYGNIPLMLFKNCPIKNGKDCRDCNKNSTLTDRMGIEFPVRCRMGYSELLNSLPIWLADRKNEINLDFAVLYFTKETKERASEVITAYNNGTAPDVKHTRGLYYRGTV